MIGDGVSLLHRVTLGGSGVRDGKRHPTIGAAPLEGFENVVRFGMWFHGQQQCSMLDRV